jgi:hypothetical protein
LGTARTTGQITWHITLYIVSLYNLLPTSALMFKTRGLSKKQRIFRNYLIKELGFPADRFTVKYIRILSTTCQQFRILGALPPEYDLVEDEPGQAHQVLRNSSSFLNYIFLNDMFIPSAYGLLDYLNDEISYKKNKKYKTKEWTIDAISASDISNFVFCPVSFSINKTFELPKLEIAITGTLLHENRLLRLILELTDPRDEHEWNKRDSHYTLFKSSAPECFDELLGAKVLFSGHDTDCKGKFFTSRAGKLFSQPDFIFKTHEGEHVVVEEKYYTGNPRTTFYENHVSQLRAYLFGIPDFEITHGYLIYWGYSLTKGYPSLTSCSVLKVFKNDVSKKMLSETLTEMKGFLSEKAMSFNPSLRNPKKCANCVSNFACGHKTGQFDKVTFPYSSSFMQIKRVNIPEVLKKQA